MIHTKIKNWQVHNISVPGEIKDLFKEKFPEILFPPCIFTGEVQEDFSGRWECGFHMRSSYIVSISEDRSLIKTENSLYQLDPETENNDMFPDLGNGALGIFY